MATRLLYGVRIRPPGRLCEGMELNGAKGVYGRGGYFGTMHSISATRGQRGAVSKGPERAKVLVSGGSRRSAVQGTRLLVRQANLQRPVEEMGTRSAASNESTTGEWEAHRDGATRVREICFDAPVLAGRMQTFPDLLRLLIRARVEGF